MNHFPFTYSTVVFSQKFKKAMKKFPRTDYLFIKKYLEKILNEAIDPNIKQLKNYKIASYRMRIGNFRILFNIDSKKEKYLFMTIRRRKDLY